MQSRRQNKKWEDAVYFRAVQGYNLKMLVFFQDVMQVNQVDVELETLVDDLSKKKKGERYRSGLGCSEDG